MSRVITAVAPGLLAPDERLSEQLHAEPFRRLVEPLGCWRSLRWRVSARGTCFVCADCDAMNSGASRSDNKWTVSWAQLFPCETIKKGQKKFPPTRMNTYMKTETMATGMRKISENAIRRKMFLCWNSTSEINKRAPHQLFWPNICERENTRLVNVPQRFNQRC